MKTKEQERATQVRRVKRGYYRKLRQTLREQIFIKLGDKCALCGFADPRALHIDHIFNDGGEERKKLSQNSIYRKVLTDTEGRYQILCANCNWIKKSERVKLKWGEIPK